MCYLLVLQRKKIIRKLIREVDVSLSKFGPRLRRSTHLTHCRSMPIQRWRTLLLMLCFAVLSSVGAETLPNSTKSRSRHGPHSLRLHLTWTPEHFRNASGKSRTCSVVEYGAVGDGTFMSTPFIQAAIDACGSEEGGGVVYFPPGMYLTGTIFVKSNITLYIAEGATVLGSSQQKDFPPDAARWYTILVENASYVAIRGGGVIDGQGRKFVVTFDESKNVMVSWNQTGDCEGKACRPRLAGIVNCTNVHISNIEFRDPPLWCLHVNISNIVEVHNVSIFGDFNSPSNDGIDIDSSNNTLVQNCHIDTADDGIVSKTTAGALFNLTVHKCCIRSKSCAVKLGSESRFDFSNIIFDDITISESHRGLGIQLRDQGSIRNITFSSIVINTRYYDPSWWGNSEPIYVTACPRDPLTKVGSVSGVHFVNISITTENGIFLAGSQGSMLQSIEFRNVSMNFVSSTNFTGGLHDYRPGCRGLVSHHMSGIFMEHIAEASLQDIVQQWSNNLHTRNWGIPLDFTPSIVFMLALRNFHTVQEMSTSLFKE